MRATSPATKDLILSLASQGGNNDDPVDKKTILSLAGGNQSSPTDNNQSSSGGIGGLTGAWLNAIMPTMKQRGMQIPQLLMAGALNIPKQAYNMGVQGVNNLLGTNLQRNTWDTNKLVGLPTDQGTEGYKNLTSGALASLITAPEGGADTIIGRLGSMALRKVLPQAAVGASLDSNDRTQGALTGGALSLMNPALSGLKNVWGTGGSVIDNAKSIFAAKNAALDASSQAASSKFVSKMIARRLDNQDDYNKAYGILKSAGTHPIPGLKSPLKESMNNVADQMDGMFGPTEASQDVRDNPEQYGNNYTPEEGFTPDQMKPVDDLLGKNFGGKLSKHFTPQDDIGGNNNPIKPMDAYNRLVANPTIENAEEARRIFNTAKDSPYIKSMPGMAGAFKIAGNNIDKNMLIPALMDHDKTFGTNLTKEYMKASPGYREEKTWSDISPQLDSLSSGNWLTGDLTHKNVSSVISNAAKGKKLPDSDLGNFLRNEGETLQSKISDNVAKQEKNKVLEKQKIASIGKRGGLTELSGNIAPAVGRYVAPLAQTYGLGKLQSQNPSQ